MSLTPNLQLLQTISHTTPLQNETVYRFEGYTRKRSCSAVL